MCPSCRFDHTGSEEGVIWFCTNWLREHNIYILYNIYLYIYIFIISILGPLKNPSKKKPPTLGFPRVNLRSRSRSPTRPQRLSTKSGEVKAWWITSDLGRELEGAIVRLARCIAGACFLFPSFLYIFYIIKSRCDWFLLPVQLGKMRHWANRMPWAWDSRWVPRGISRQIWMHVDAGAPTTAVAQRNQERCCWGGPPMAGDGGLNVLSLYHPDFASVNFKTYLISWHVLYCLIMLCIFHEQEHSPFWGS